MSNTTASWRDELKDWIKNQHGTAGWEQKLENFISQVEQEAHERGKRDTENDTPLDFPEIMPKNQCTDCGAWVSDELKDKHNCKKINRK